MQLIIHHSGGSLIRKAIINWHGSLFKWRCVLLKWLQLFRYGNTRLKYLIQRRVNCHTNYLVMSIEMRSTYASTDSTPKTLEPFEKKTHLNQISECENDTFNWNFEFKQFPEISFKFFLTSGNAKKKNMQETVYKLWSISMKLSSLNIICMHWNVENIAKTMRLVAHVSSA